MWAANYNEGTVSRIDVATRARVQTIEAGTTPAGLAVGGGSVWVTNNYGGTVSRIDPAVDRVVQTIPVGNAPAGVAVGYGSVWVANSSDGTLTPDRRGQRHRQGHDRARLECDRCCRGCGRRVGQ